MTGVVLGLHFDGADNGTVFNEATGKTVTRVGNVVTKTAVKQFGSASAYFDGSGDGLELANHPDFDFGSGDLTIAGWLYIAGNSAADVDGARGACIVSTWNASVPISGWALNVLGDASTTGTGLALDSWDGSGNATLFRAAVTISHEVLHYFEATVSGGVRRLFLDGDLLSGSTTTIGSGYTPLNALSNPLRIGSTRQSGYPLTLHGYLDDLWINKGVAEHTASFTPPDAPFADLIAEVTPEGIPSAEAFGTPALEHWLAVPSIPSAEAFGAPELVASWIINPVGIPSDGAFGTPRFERLLIASSIPSGEVFGAPALAYSGLRLAIPDFAQWSPVVTLGGVDVSSALVGEVLVEAEEGAARLADFRLQVAAGTSIHLTQYVGKPVTIDFAEAGGVNPVRLFTGVVDLPAFDFASRTIAFRCTDDLKGAVSAMSRAAIDTLIGGKYSPAVFDETADTWQYAQDRSSTAAGSLDLSPTGTVRWTEWAPAGAADFEFTASHIADATSVEIALADRGSVRNRIDIAFSHRFHRLKKRSASVSIDLLDGVALWADFLADGKWLLPRDVVRNALSGAGWSVVGGDAGITFAAAPAAGVYNSSLGESFVWNNVAPGTICTGFSATLSKCYSQVIDEAYAIRVENAASVALLGALAEEQAEALESSFDAAAWEQASNAQPAGGGFASAVVVPALSTAPAGGETTLDYFPDDKTSRAAAQAAIETLVARAQTRIYAAHRQNALRFSVPLTPTLDTVSTVAVTVPGISAKGKARRVTHRMNLDSGAAMSDLDVAICAVSGPGYSHPSDPPIAPETPPQIGMAGGASTTIVAVYPNLPAEDHQLTLTFPAIDDQSRDNYAPVVNQTYAAPVVEDLFEVTA